MEHTCLSHSPVICNVIQVTIYTNKFENTVNPYLKQESITFNLKSDIKLTFCLVSSPNI